MTVQRAEVANSAAAPEREPHDELAARLQLSVTRLARRLRTTARDDVTASQLSALSSLACRGALTLGELSAVELVRPPTMTKIVASLEEAGLVLRSVDHLDRRVARVELTAKGRTLLDQRRLRKDAYLAEQLRRLSPADREALVRAADALDRLVDGPE
ncbi:MAG: MarR family winged helix-turn-helix transcriptional regulator [Acidimicrobiales bacterium]